MFGLSPHEIITTLAVGETVTAVLTYNRGPTAR